MKLKYSLFFLFFFFFVCLLFFVLFCFVLFCFFFWGGGVGVVVVCLDLVWFALGFISSYSSISIYWAICYLLMYLYIHLLTYLFVGFVVVVVVVVVYSFYLFILWFLWHIGIIVEDVDDADVYQISLSTPKPSNPYIYHSNKSLYRTASLSLCVDQWSHPEHATSVTDGQRVGSSDRKSLSPSLSVRLSLSLVPL